MEISMVGRKPFGGGRLCSDKTVDKRSTHLPLPIQPFSFCLKLDSVPTLYMAGAESVLNKEVCCLTLIYMAFVF